MRKTDDTKWIEPIALACADSFLKAAQSSIDPERIRKALPEGQFGIAEHGHALGDLAVCATNLAFAIEIYLKCLRAQVGLPTRTQGSGHDLWKLYEDLPAHTRKEIEERYERGRTHPHPTYASITFSHSRNPKPPVWSDIAEKSMCVAEVLKRSKDVFVSWRYVFEVKDSYGETGHQLHTFEYLLLLFACTAINAVILRNWFTPQLAPGPDAPRAWMVLNDEDFAKVYPEQMSVTAEVTDQYTGKRYRVRNLSVGKGVETIAEELRES
ncbi:MAG: hypothetical protein HW373_858, partial [Deltaproteobacteria bacterium]|nr:hypothetical protein [Deltaproteobacteria bacterium]